ncbi:MAG: hypothetical protein RLP44_25745 [Aggregatilineales bacterium]
MLNLLENDYHVRELRYHAEQNHRIERHLEALKDANGRLPNNLYDKLRKLLSLAR